MIVREVINRKSDSKKKIAELLCFLNSGDTFTDIEASGAILNALFDEIDNYRNCKILLAESNSKTSILVEGKSVPVSRAVLVRDSIYSKIDVFNGLIENKVGGILGVMEQRDALLSEFNSLDVVINRSDLNTEVGT